MNPQNQYQQYDPSQSPVAPPQPPTTTLKPTDASTLSVIGLTLAFLVPPIGTIISIIGFRKATRMHVEKRIFSLLGIIFGFVGTIMLIVTVIWFYYFFSTALEQLAGSDRENLAKTEVSSMSAPLEQSGAELICAEGLSGYGLKAGPPWYVAYYDMPAGQAQYMVEGIVQNNGYQIANNDYQELEATGSMFESSSTITASNGDKDFEADFYEEGSRVIMDCDYGGGNTFYVDTGRTAVRIKVTLPSIDTAN